MKNEIYLEPIGYVVCDVRETVDENWGDVISKIELLPEFHGGLLGLEDFSHALILTYLDKSKYEKEKHLKRRPRGLESMPLIGIFSQRAKDRPNPIGVTTVKIEKVAENFLEIRGLDAIHNTPVLDIKPYYFQYDRIENPSAPDWVERLMENYF